MKTPILVSACALLAAGLKAQTFEEIPAFGTVPSAFAGVDRAAIASADFDRDGDLDYIVAGLGVDDRATTILYVNRGSGTFDVKGAAGLPGFYYGDIAAGDLDGDGDVDVLVTGRTNAGERGEDGLTEVYLNDGAGNFSLRPAAGLAPLYQSSVALADVDGDGDLDAAVLGRGMSGPASYVYVNDGTGGFTEWATQLPGLVDGDATFLDADGQLGLDLVLAGRANDYPKTQLFLNDGHGGYAPSPVILIGAAESGVSAGDLDGDGATDLVFAGFSARQRDLFIYFGDGGGRFSGYRVPDFVGVNRAAVALADSEGDGDLDIVVSGYAAGGQLTLHRYVNDGTAAFTPAESDILFGLEHASLAYVDIDTDNRPDLLAAGGGVEGPRAELYLGRDDGTLELAPGATIEGAAPGLMFGTVDLADYDSDGDNDLFVTGLDEQGAARSLLFANEDSGLRAVPLDGVPGVYRSGSVFADLNGDSLPDLAVVGRSTGSGPVAHAGVYLNHGGRFVERAGGGLPALANAASASADVDGDGDLDIALLGFDERGDRTTQLFLNDGTGVFLPSRRTPFDGVADGALSFADVDGDGDADLVVAGRDRELLPSTVLYRNDGLGGFTRDRAAGNVLAPVAESSIVGEDLDGDGDIDLALAGFTTGRRFVGVYLNDGSGGFAEVSDRSDLIGVNRSHADASDVDGDGDLDLLVTGYTDRSNAQTTLYLNGGNASFTIKPIPALPNLQHGRAVFGDLDGSGLEDLVLAGSNSDDGSTNPVLLAYRNVAPVTGVKEPSETNISALIYPNPIPADGTFLVEYDGASGQPVDVEIHGVDGRLVRMYRGVTSVSTAGISVAGLPVGTYLLTVSETAGRFSGLLQVR